MLFLDIAREGAVQSLLRILSDFNIDTIIHCAALKNVQVGYSFPEITSHENLISFLNLRTACLSSSEKRKLLLCSTDKSATPTSVMGASKLLLERIITSSFQSNVFISAVRFGNIIGSSDSVVPLMAQS